MERVPVESSNILSIGYNAETATLEVEFHNGSIYQYYNISAELHDGLMKAGSKGTYLDQHIKKAGYPYNKVG
jgi:hypothetical protein